MSKFTSFDLSMPQSRTVRGCEINRMPFGAFMQAIKLVEGFLPQMLEVVFPEMGVPEAVLALKSRDRDVLGQALARVLMVVPEQAVKLISKLTMIPEDKLKADANISLDGLGEIMNAWYEVNRIESFFGSALGLYQRLRAQTKNPMTTGFST